MKKTDLQINLALAFDENYLIPFYIVLTSIFANNTGKRFILHLIATGVTDEAKDTIRLYCTQNGSEVSFYNIDIEYVKTFAVSNEPRYTLAIYYRLLIPFLIPNNISKIIYLDTDIVVIGDLSQLLNIQMGEVPAAFGVDPVIRPDLNINEIGEYFNSGVILINVKHWLKQKVTEKAISFLQANSEKVIYGDQDALNVTLKGNWLKFSIRFNLTFRHIPRLSNEEYKEFLVDKIVIHYNNSHKPWNFLCRHPLQVVYFEYFHRFISSEVGKYLNSRNIEIQFLRITIDMLTSVSFSNKNDEDFLKTQFTCAYYLHLVIIKALNTQFGDAENIFSSQIKKYYSKYEHSEDRLALNVVLDEHRELLLEIFQRVMSPASPNSLPNWLVCWGNLCRKEFTLNETIPKYTYEAQFTKLANLVNTQLQVNGLSEVILFYLIKSIMEMKAPLTDLTIDF